MIGGKVVSSKPVIPPFLDNFSFQEYLLIVWSPMHEYFIEYNEMFKLGMRALESL